MTIQNNGLSLLERIAGFAGAHVIPGKLTRSGAILSYWYQANGYHKFLPNDIIDLNKKRLFYGNDLPWKIDSYKDDENYFVIDSKNNRMMQYKWNIEHDFRRI